MIDQLSQLGAAAWRPLLTARGERTDFRTDRLERIAEEAAKQCGRAWTLEIGPPLPIAEALALPGALLADAAGRPASPLLGEAAALLVGPEGGFTPEEIAAADAAGVPRLRLGAHILRIETAAAAGAAALLAGAR